jgi:predicted outer membrane lipoprotein
MIFSRLVFWSVFVSTVSFGANVGNGANLFDGTKPFKNGGVACVACHNVNNTSTIRGGSLAKDLTPYGGEMASTLQYMLEESGVISSPIMVEAYEGKELTKDEIADLVSFFKTVDVASTDNGSGSYFWIFGLILAAIFYVLTTKMDRRKTLRESVNQELYDRQIKSSWRE